MMPHPRWPGRVIALWTGLLAACVAVLVIAYLRDPERLGTATVITTVVALIGGIARTRWLVAQDDESLITPADLRLR